MGVRSRVHRVGAAALMVPAVVGAQAGAPATSALPAPVQAVPAPTAPVHATESPMQPVSAPVGEPAQRPGDPALRRQGITPDQAALSGAASASAESRLSELLLDGLILDATVTPRGRDFFRSFVEAWRLLDARTRYTVTLREQPSPRQGSVVSVEFRGRAVLRSALSPNRAVSSEQSGLFARAAYDAVLEYEAERVLFRSPDLAPEEL
jgi:curli production assembly/transport component CsgE